MTVATPAPHTAESFYPLTYKERSHPRSCPCGLGQLSACPRLDTHGHVVISYKRFAFVYSLARMFALANLPPVASVELARCATAIRRWHATSNHLGWQRATDFELTFVEQML
jgi:hypothetical protein